MVLSPERTGLAEGPLLALRLAVSALLAVASYVVVERPVRAGRLRRVPLAGLVPVGAVACIGLVVLATTGTTPPRPADPLAAVPVVEVETLAADAPPRVLILGDSVANSIAVPAQVIANGLGAHVASAAVDGCALSEEVTDLRLVTAKGPVPIGFSPPCPLTWLEATQRFRPDIVAVVYGNAGGFEEFRLGNRWMGACDGDYGAWYEDHLDTVLAEVAATGATVVVSTVPYQENVDGIEDGRRRVDCMNRINRLVADRLGLRSVDLAGWVCPSGVCRDEEAGTTLRSDGIHFGLPSPSFGGPAGEGVAAWFVGRVLEVAALPDPALSDLAFAGLAP